MASSTQAWPFRRTSVTRLCYTSWRSLPTPCCARWNLARFGCRSSHWSTMRWGFWFTWRTLRSRTTTHGPTSEPSSLSTSSISRVSHSKHRERRRRRSGVCLFRSSAHFKGAYGCSTPHERTLAKGQPLPELQGWGRHTLGKATPSCTHGLLSRPCQHPVSP